MNREIISTLLLGILLLGSVRGQNSGSGSGERSHVPCYDNYGRAQRCFPPFVNAAFGLPVEATNTCGMRGSEEFCQQTGISGATKSCDVCDASDPRKSHQADYLTDFHSVEVLSWWQSSTMMDTVQYPNSVNLTLRLGKSFEITYVRLKFHSSRPESFAIYKRTTSDGQWEPYQFYSGSCQETYRLPVSPIVSRNNEAQALCRDDFSDISPLTGGSVAFSTLEGRPSAYEFENSPVLQEWVTATEIKIVLNRINTFRDEVFGDPKVLRSYFYAISDFAVGGRCKCNGHASECIRTQGPRGLQLACRCEHNTTGPDCNECLPFYNDKPWRRASQHDANECSQCNCNGLAERCTFDEELFRRTGHGGRCEGCRDNTAGPNCERCNDGFYKRDPRDRCLPCSCNPTGSRRTQCDANGGCECKPGVGGEKCDRCLPNFFGFGPNGCRQCQCNLAGSANNRPDCVSESGQCRCKENVEGQNCERCKQGFFGLSESDPQGCIPCFCYGHSNRCTAASGYIAMTVHSDFDSGVQRWTAQTSRGQEVALQPNQRAGNIGATAQNSETVYFVAPERYLGDQRHSYNLLLTFNLRVGDDRIQASAEDIILEGNGYKITAAIFHQNNPSPRTVDQEYKFRLSEHPTYQWSPHITGIEFMKLLSNVTSLKIRATYSSYGTGYIDNVKLQSARAGSGGTPANNVEMCQCPEGYVGQFCESCAPGYRRDPPNGGPFARCVPCNCNKHAMGCHPDTGKCMCKDNTAGDNCEKCAPGFYGYPLAGGPDDCKPCPCPDQGQCVQLLNGEVACVGCREGYSGQRCNLCQDGYFGDPEGQRGARTPCRKCECNDNIDSNAVGNCDRFTGECLKCIYNTAGFHCEKCMVNHFGDALALPKGQCKPCNCHVGGSQERRPGEVCDQRTGQCICKHQVTGKYCDTCLEGYWNIDSGNGCEPCNCDYTGSLNTSCDARTGKCHCKPGVNERDCSKCAPNHYGFSRDGCKACNCNPDGSRSQQCNPITGECDCLPNIGGRHCNKCAENKHNIAAGCIDCPACYNLVQQQVNDLRRKIAELRLIIKNIRENPGAVDDADFRRKLVIVQDYVIRLVEDARRLSGVTGGASTEEQLHAIRAAITDIMISITTITENIYEGSRGAQNADTDTSGAERAIDEADRVLKSLEVLIEVEGKTALQKAKDAQGKLGEQSTRMTDIANEARTISLRQEEESIKIEKVSNEALNTSQEALRIAQAALQKPDQIENDLVNIRRQINGASNMYNDTKRMAEDAQKRAQEVYKESLSIYTDISSITISKTDVTTITTDITRIRDDAKNLKDEANSVIEEHRILMSQIEKEKFEATRLIEIGTREQQQADELLAEADAARTMAREAVEKAERLLREARETLNILLEFDQKVRDSKAGAEEAMKKIPQIEAYIRQAEEKTVEAQRNLRGAEADAVASKELAMQAQVLAERAIKEITEIRTETEVTRHRSEELTRETEEIRADVDEIERRLSSLERQAEQDAILAQQALEKADQAKTSAVSSSTKVSMALTTVNDILRQLETLDKIDINKLIELERSLHQAEQTLIEANIDVRYEDLQKLYVEMTYWVSDYTSQLIVLTQDVENIRQINATIPRTCFKKFVLEPTNPTNG